jgi:hypothetical protein
LLILVELSWYSDSRQFHQDQQSKRKFKQW